MRNITPIRPSGRRRRAAFTDLSNPPKIPLRVVLLRKVVRSTLPGRIGQPWAKVAAAIAELPRERREVLYRLVRTDVVMRDGRPHYPRGGKNNLSPLDSADLNSCGYYVCPATGTLQFLKYESLAGALRLLEL